MAILLLLLLSAKWGNVKYHHGNYRPESSHSSLNYSVMNKLNCVIDEAWDIDRGFIIRLQV